MGQGELIIRGGFLEASPLEQRLGPQQAGVGCLGFQFDRGDEVVDRGVGPVETREDRGAIDVVGRLLWRERHGVAVCAGRGLEISDLVESVSEVVPGDVVRGIHL